MVDITLLHPFDLKTFYLDMSTAWQHDLHVAYLGFYRCLMDNDTPVMKQSILQSETWHFRLEKCLQDQMGQMTTPPKFNSSPPEKWSFLRGKSRLPIIIFSGGYVRFWRVNTHDNYTRCEVSKSRGRYLWTSLLTWPCIHNLWLGSMAMCISPRFMIGDRNGDVVEHTSRIGKAAKEVD